MSAKKKSKRADDSQPKIAVGVNENEHLEDFVERSMYEYGSHVVQSRAIPDYRDGLKPVHRAILWSMYKLGLHYNSPYKKAARTVGDVIGKYHPHGDKAAYDAMVTIANTVPNLVDGFGNWGRHDSEAGAMRYTESRLSEFSDKFLLDPTYLSVVPMVQNFSNDELWPVFLPAKLPVVLLTGTVRAPAFGVSIGMPAFKIEGVLKAVRMCLAGEDFSSGSKKLAKILQLNSRYGGEVVSSISEIAQVIKTGNGGIKVKCETRYDRNKRELYIESCSPAFGSENTIEKKLSKLRTLNGVKDVEDESSKGTGKYNIRYTVRFGKTSDHLIEPLIQQIEKELTGTLQFNVGYTNRKKDGSAEFEETSVVRLINRWCEYRVRLESAVIKKLIQDNLDKLKRQEMLEFAVNHLADIFAALKTKDPDAFLIKKWKKPAEFVKSVLDLQVRRLATLELKDIHAKQKEIKNVIKGLERDAKKPAERVLRSLDEVDTYIKKTRDNL